MLKQYPMLRYVLQKGFWYLLTFVFAVALNFALPRLGDNNPVDIIMGQAGKGLSPTEAQKKKAELLVSFGMAEVDQLLSAIPLMTDSVEIAKAYRELNKIFMEDQPSIPLVYLPEQFYEFSDRVWTNWPTAENPYAPAQLPWVASGTKILWNLKLAK